MVGEDDGRLRNRYLLCPQIFHVRPTWPLRHDANAGRLEGLAT
jgi:hypothetical protein